MSLNSPSQLPVYLDYLTVLQYLADYRKPRDKLRELIAAGDIVRVKKGLYLIGPKFNKPYSKLVLANLIYGPSYVSSLSALSFWGLIPERVEELQSVTPKRRKSFHTPVGNFVYRYCPLSAYRLGFILTSVTEDHSACIATPEKALCDYLVAEQSTLKSSKAME